MQRKKFCYLDYNATTPLVPEVLAAMTPYLGPHYGNASSVHGMGSYAREAAEQAREQVAELINANPREIIFTSGATESNNAAIQSALLEFPKKKKIVISSVEHSSVKNVAGGLAKRSGLEIVSIKVDSKGNLDLKQLESELTDDVALVSVMWVNNETGVIFQVEKIAALVKSKKILFHVDAVQAAGKLTIDLAKVPADFLSLSAHKFYGPKGTGILFVREGVSFHPFVLGGTQEHGKRGGTLNVAGVVGMGRAAEWVLEKSHEKHEYVTNLRDRLEEQLTKAIPSGLVNGREANRVSNTISLTIPNVPAEVLLPRLDEAGICASSGSACLSGAFEPSHVLLAMGLSEESALCSIRISLGFTSTEEEIDCAAKEIPRIVSEILSLTPPLSLREREG